MKKRIFISGVLVIFLWWYFSKITLHIITPLGWSPTLWGELDTYLTKHDIATFLLYSDGELVASAGDIHENYRAHSMRKSLLNGLYGTFMLESAIDTAKNLQTLGIDDKNTLSDQEKTAKIIHLLKSRSGIYHDAASVTPAVRKRRPSRGIHQPNETWFYNNWDFNALGLILEQETKEKIFDAFEKRIATPLAFKDFDKAACWYQYENGSNIPSHKFKISTYDLLQFGKLYLNKGMIKGKKILEESWIETSFHKHSNTQRTGLDAHYGLMWWISEKNATFPYTCYSASGSKGHKMTIIPELKTIIIQRVNTNGVNYILQKGIKWSDYEKLVATIIKAKQ